MTAREMQLHFERRIGQLGLPIGRELSSFDIEGFLNDAQEIVYLDSYSKFDSDELSKKILAEYIGATQIMSFNTVTAKFANGYVVQMPSDFKLALQESAVYNGIVIPVKPVTLDQYNANIKNPLKNPCADLVWRIEAKYTDPGSAPFDWRKSHELVTDGLSTLSKYDCVYLSKLEDISISNNTPSYLDPIVHNRIIDIAIGLAANRLPREQVSNEKSSK